MKKTTAPIEPKTATYRAACGSGVSRESGGGGGGGGTGVAAPPFELDAAAAAAVAVAAGLKGIAPGVRQKATEPASSHTHGSDAAAAAARSLRSPASASGVPT